MINIRTIISNLFDQYAHNVVYIRRNLKFRCSCYVERSGESSIGCSKCFGTGYVVEATKMRTRRKIASVPETLIGVNQLHEVGTLAPKAYQYYLEYDKSPEKGDLILEVEWDEKGNPSKILEKNLISTIEPLLGHKGRIEFYNVYVRYDKKGSQDDKSFT